MTLSIQSGAGQYGGAERPSFDEMKAKFSQMKEKIRGSNPDMAKKLDEFETKISEKTKGGMSEEDAMKAVGEELGLPDPSQMKGKFGQFGQGFGGDEQSFSSYNFRGQGVKDDSIKQLLDMLG